MEIRRAKLTDIPQIMNIINEVVPIMIAAGNLQWDDYYPNAEVFKNDISLEQLWVADIDGRIAGAAAITTEQSPEYAAIGWDITQTAIVTHRLVVNPEYRGQGIAAALLQQAERVAVQRNIKLLRIDTNTKNEATQKLFPKMGYIYAGEIGLDFRPGLRFYCYEKELTNEN
ncbi:GNAT family N-acetyltransferase [Mucilaginibacter segetis]|uniref:GNAT family N-acetyltransferase n=1 Tax=Mucilaginibacter segetis TaxID=2793071 RepID=A0A934ULU8_9SPHI|nr:GNAT family N-acetyltransferase [Mucilaginibacter segetis]MBK0378340.1 GNAT family N-acetyltransferase [Mucilaginibacter segetis]